MQCTSYFPGCYSRRDLNWTANGGPWPTYSNNISPNMSGQSYSYFSLPPIVDQIEVVDHNEAVRQTMLRHEYVFREQVQELHRLHRRQREWMDEFKRKMQETNIVPMSRYNFILPKVSSDCAAMTWQTPTSPTLPWINQAENRLSSPVTKSALSPKCKKPKLKMLDFERPADDYVDSEEEKGNEVQMNSSPCSNVKNVNMMAFDLNMPPTFSLESEIPQTNIKIEIGAKPGHNDNPSKEREEFVTSQDSLIPIHVESKASTKFVIDLNSCVDEDEPSPTLPFSKTISEIDMEPVSPENKESLAPRGESEENLLDTRVQMSKEEDTDSNANLVITAAETIILMSRSSFHEKTLGSVMESLDWFAGVVISSMAKNLEAYEAGMSSDGNEKVETKCIIGLPSQQGKRHVKRSNRNISETIGFRSSSSLMNYSFSSGEKGIKSWVMVNKRQREARVPASSVRLLWS